MKNQFFLLIDFTMSETSYLSSSLFVLIIRNQVLCDGKWSEEDASVLVLGDIISIKLGDIVPIDACLLEGDPLKIDQVNLHKK